MIFKANNDFYSDKSKKLGLSTYCKKCTISKSKQYLTDNKENIVEYKRNYYKTNKEQISSKNKQYRCDNKDKISETKRRYVKNNYESFRESKNAYKQKRLQNPILRLQENLRTRLRHALKTKNWTHTTHFSKYIGCSKEVLFNHLETQFKDNMTWNNYGKWHIDHIIPLSSAKTEEEIYKLCHYTNLQPLWATENIKKSNKCLL